ncbi:hypothetical protein DFR70_1011117 [Nocardia tenerifensis]|uniref:Uncharacterized protein n=1 Tax=Nocardia tenerifensis TaxID=228006 RepID=A0A318KHP0_9NOCA|nr:hypothetical protein [Nocardia tenerifensis]PXX71683.1 hypothetical protein DFR70_1011117 [Nocardia tenerifensis]
MEHARTLLNTPSSELATVLRYGLIGLRSGVAAAYRVRPDDPGAAACREVIRVFDELLDAKAPEEHDSARTAPDRALTILLRSPSAPAWLRDPAAAPHTLRRRMHLATLRLPEPEAAVWRDAVTEALGSPEPSGRWRDLPGTPEIVLCPPSMAGEGYRLLDSAPIDDEIARRLGLATRSPDSFRRELARLATIVAAMVDGDPDLVLALESVNYKGLCVFTEANRAAYHRDLLYRLGEYGRTRYGSPESFEALVLVDEALQSVLHMPVAAGGSWWSGIHERARALVFNAQRDHPGVHLQLLAHPYRQIRGKTGDNDVRIRSDGSGNVLRCLRLWAEVDGKRLPGRVVYSG